MQLATDEAAAPSSDLAPSASRPQARRSRPAERGYCRRVSSTTLMLVVVLVVFVLVPAIVVGSLFVWAAIEDGREDRRVQARLGIRRRTRLGR
jgi:hypothetical protein